MKKIDEIMAGIRTVVIMGHVKPDGDCVGSCLGLRAYLTANYEVQADVFLEPFAQSLAFLDEEGAVNPQREPDQAYDIAFVLDCSEPGRIGAGKERLACAKQTVCIDHHISNPGFGEICIVWPDCSSASEAVYALIDEKRLNRSAAMCLYTGIIHDTGVFQYSNVSPLTMSRAGRLISFGFDYASIISESFYEKSYAHQRLLGYAVETAGLTEDGNGIWSCVTLADMERFGCTLMETEGIVETLRNTKGVDYAVLLYETEPGVFKASFRSKHMIDVSRAAAAFGGGGHVRAAGCSFAGQTPRRMIQMITKEIAGQIHD